MGGEDDDKGEEEDLGVVQRVVDIRPVRGAGNKLLVSQLHFYIFFYLTPFVAKYQEVKHKQSGKESLIDFP